MHLVLVVPQLLGLPPEAYTACAALGRLARYAPAPTPFPDGLDVGLLAALGCPQDTPCAPLAALGAGFDPGDALVMRADPISLIAGRDNVRLAGRVDDLSTPDTQALVDALNAHFAADGITFHASRPDAWFLTTTIDEAPTTTALPAVTGAIHAQMPRGRQSVAWRRWLSEMQMLLHAAAANAARESAGYAAANGIWISGGGRLREVAPAPVVVCAATQREGDVARGLALHAGTVPLDLPANHASLPVAERVVAVLPKVADVDALHALDVAWLAPAVAALERAALDSLTVVADATGNAAHLWRARRPAWHRRLVAHISPAPFVPPAPGGEE